MDDPTKPQIAELPATPLTLDGSFILHQMFHVRWTAWQSLGSSDRKHILTNAVSKFIAMEQNQQEPTGLFSMLGHKGDLMVVHFRKTLDEINQAEHDDRMIEDHPDTAQHGNVFSDARGPIAKRLGAGIDGQTCRGLGTVGNKSDRVAG